VKRSDSNREPRDSDVRGCELMDLP
jgi:hypothetical protein